jgi:hypothetical protein
MSIFGAPSGAKDPVFCTRCCFAGPHKVTREITGGQWAALVALLLCFVIPGVIYAIHLGTGGGSRYVRVCPKCSARRMWVPLNSPAARASKKYFEDDHAYDARVAEALEGTTEGEEI